MPFREKSAWISLVCLLGTFGVFFFLQMHGMVGPTQMHHLHWFLMAIVAFVVLQIILQVIARALAPRDAASPVDERERLIMLKAGRNAHVALMIGVIAMPLSLHLSGHLHVHPEALPWIAMASLFVSEVVRAISKIVYFRLGR